MLFKILSNRNGRLTAGARGADGGGVLFALHSSSIIGAEFLSPQTLGITLAVVFLPTEGVESGGALGNTATRCAANPSDPFPR